MSADNVRYPASRPANKPIWLTIRGVTVEPLDLYVTRTPAPAAGKMLWLPWFRGGVGSGSGSHGDKKSEFVFTPNFTDESQLSVTAAGCSVAQ